MTEHVTKQKPFPWRCPKCGLKEVRPSVAPYAAEVKHDGRVHEVAIDQLEIPTCQSCGEKVFSKHVDDQISQALRRQLRLFSPNEIRSALRSLGMPQKELARRLGVAEATLSRWATFFMGSPPSRASAQTSVAGAVGSHRTRRGPVG